MIRGSNGPLYAGVGLGALVLAALAWMLGISPRIERAADAEESRVAQEATNFELETQLATLKVEFENLPELRESIYAIRDEFPPAQGLPEFRRQANELFEANKLVILRETVGEGAVVTNKLSLKAQAAAVGLTSTIEGLDFTNLVATPVNWQFGGDVDTILNTIYELQHQDERYFLMSALRVTAVIDEQNNADVVLEPGEVVVDVSGYIFTLDYGVPAISVRPPEPEVPVCVVRPEDDEPVVTDPEVTDPEAAEPDAPETDSEILDPETGEPLPFCPPERDRDINYFEPLS